MKTSIAGQRMCPGTAIAAISLAAACGVPGHAAGVFSPVGVLGPAGRAAQASATEADQGHFVRIAHSELQRARAEVGEFGRSRLLLNMSEGVAFDVKVERTAQTHDGYTLSGNIDGGKGGFVTLVAHQEAVAGSIWTWGANYEVAPVGDGIHAVRRVVDEPLECGVVRPPTTELNAPAPTNSASDEPAVVDILVFWTPAVEAARGGERYVKLLIDFAIAYTNDALERSGALVSLNLAGSERADLDDINAFDLVRDDVLARVHATERADMLGADFISIFAAGTTGVASGLRDGTPVSVFGMSHLGGTHVSVFAHEVGHNLGLRHDRGASGYPNLSYNGGYASISANYMMTRCHMTIMSYSTICLSASSLYTTIPYYSTPNRYHPGTGTPLGVSRLSNVRNWDGPADAVFAINVNRHRSSGIRPRPSSP